MTSKELGQALRRLREGRSLSVDEVCARGEAFAAVERWEVGKEDPSLAQACGLLDAIGADFCDLEEALQRGSASAAFEEILEEMES